MVSSISSTTTASAARSSDKDRANAVPAKPVPADEAAWWLRAYELYEADLALPEGERAESNQELFDRVGA